MTEDRTEAGRDAGYNPVVRNAERYRCGSCGNLTRFDVFETRRSRRFHHYSLAGELTIEEEETLDLIVEKIICRWCGSDESIEVVPLTADES